jgi:hypothetical protein
MKMLSLIMTLGSLFSAQSFAQTMQISGGGPLLLNCNFSKGYTPSENMVKITKSKQSVAHCTNNNQVFEIAYFNMKINVNETASKKTLNLRCTGDSASGIYLFGGYPMGFQTQSSSKAPWFYKVQEGNGAGSGRCFMEYDSDFISGIEASKNESMMVLLEVGAN